MSPRPIILATRLAIAFCLIASCGLTEQPDGHAPPSLDPFFFVTVDVRTEAALGQFPYDRTILAKAVTAAQRAGARAIVLNMYLDQPGSEAGDRAMLEAMAKVPVVLGAGLLPAEPPADRASTTQRSNPLPERCKFARFGRSKPKADEGGEAIVPTVPFSQKARDIGFVAPSGDVEHVGLIYAFQHAYVKSLHTVCLELACRDDVLVTPGVSIELLERPIPLDERGRATVDLPGKDQLKSASLIDLLRGEIPQGSIKDRIVIIGCDHARMPTVDTPAGKIGVHRAWNLQLLGLYEQLRR